MPKVLFSSAQEWALCGVTALLVRMAMQESGPLTVGRNFWFVGLRFSCAALILVFLSFPILRDITKRELVGGAVLGAAIFAGFALQTAGLATITASASAFITAFYVPLVPFFECLFMKHRPGPLAWTGMALAFPGVILLTGGDGFMTGLGMGEGLTLLCAIAFAGEIILTGIIVPGTNPRRIATVELAVGALLSFAFMPLSGEVPAPFSWLVVGSACGLGLASACIQSIIAWAQKDIPPTRATIIYTGEPVWAGLMGYMAGERLPLSALAGCVLVVTGILVSNRDGQKT